MEPLENSVFNHRNTDTADVSYLPIWSNYSFRCVAPAALLMHHLYCFGHGGSVLGMDHGQKLVKVRSPVVGIKSVNLVDLVGPIDTQILRPGDTQIAGRPAPHMSEALSFAKIELASP